MNEITKTILELRKETNEKGNNLIDKLIELITADLDVAMGSLNKAKEIIKP
jgi:hypothetical protein